MRQALSAGVPLALGQLLNDKREYEERRRSRRGVAGLLGRLRRDPFPGVSLEEAEGLFLSACRGAVGGTSFRAGELGPFSEVDSLEVRLEPMGGGAQCRLRHTSGRRGAGTEESFSDWKPLGRKDAGGKSVKEPARYDGLVPMESRLERFEKEYAEGAGKRFDDERVREAVSEARGWEKEERADRESHDRAVEEYRAKGGVRSLEDYLAAVPLLEDISARAALDPDSVGGRLRAFHECHAEDAAAYRDDPERLLKDVRETVLRGGKAPSKEDILSGLEAKAVSMRQDKALVLDDAGRVRLSRRERDSVAEGYVRCLRRCGYGKEEVRESLRELSEKDGRFRDSALARGEGLDAACLRSDAELLEEFHRLYRKLLSRRRKERGTYDCDEREAGLFGRECLHLLREGMRLKPDGVVSEAQRESHAFRLLLARLGVSEGDGPSEVAAKLLSSSEEYDPDEVLERLGGKAEPNEYMVEYDKELSRRFSEKVWVASGDDGGVPRLAGEMETKKEGKATALEVFGRELMVHAALLSEKSPALGGRFLREAGVRPVGGDMREAVFNAAARLYGDGSVEGARRVQVFRERYAGSVKEAHVEHYRKLAPARKAAPEIKAAPAGMKLSRNKD